MTEITNSAEEPEKHADLWEKTVVQAFRDLQWMLAANREGMPDINVPFAGKIESAFGDGIVAADERLFLLEFKAASSGKAAEWKDRKLAYQSLESAIRGIRSKRELVDMDPWFETSMQGHLFLYWSEEAKWKDSRVIPGDLVVSSYLLDIAKLSPISAELDACAELSAFNSLGVLQDGTSDSYALMGQVLASRLFDGTAKLVRHYPKEDAKALGLGLTPQQMQGYVGWLLERQRLRDLPINAILASRNGAICQRISHVNDLEDLLIALMNDPKPRQAFVGGNTETKLDRALVVVPPSQEDAPSYRC